MTYQEFAKLIKEKRLESNILQKDIASYLCVSISKYSKIENGQLEPKIIELSLILKYFQIDPNVLIEEKPKKHFFD
ncbi:MAG: helix-turn-helix domain-containing protein [Acholeplasmatales bacterium]|nr:helix-turn-helix domain-containing protein [Acholeplasmatales bacterium]